MQATKLATIEPFKSQVIHQIGPKGKPTRREVFQKKNDILSSLASGWGWGLSQTQCNQLLALLISYGDIFVEGTNNLGRTNVTTHTINTGTADLHPSGVLLTEFPWHTMNRQAASLRTCWKKEPYNPPRAHC